MSIRSVLPGPLGFGTAPLGNMYRAVPYEAALGVLQKLRDEYQKAPESIIARVRRIKSLSERYGVGVKAAALQFSLAHPATRAAVPGATRPSHVAEDTAALHETVPAEFWTALRQERLIAPDAPVPG